MLGSSGIGSDWLRPERRKGCIMNFAYSVAGQTYIGLMLLSNILRSLGQLRITNYCFHNETWLSDARVLVGRCCLTIGYVNSIRKPRIDLWRILHLSCQL
jgi:hypothetical protein